MGLWIGILAEAVSAKSRAWKELKSKISLCNELSANVRIAHLIPYNVNIYGMQDGINA
jgi:hypothetical protein